MLQLSIRIRSICCYTNDKNKKYINSNKPINSIASVQKYGAVYYLVPVL